VVRHRHAGTPLVPTVDQPKAILILPQKTLFYEGKKKKKKIGVSER
jgi:hypothetical protein